MILFKKILKKQKSASNAWSRQILSQCCWQIQINLYQNQGFCCPASTIIHDRCSAISLLMSIHCCRKLQTPCLGNMDSSPQINASQRSLNLLYSWWGTWYKNNTLLWILEGAPQYYSLFSVAMSVYFVSVQRWEDPILWNPSGSGLPPLVPLLPLSPLLPPLPQLQRRQDEIKIKKIKSQTYM